MASLAIGLVKTVLIGGQTFSILSKVGTDVIIRTLTTTTTAVGGLIVHVTAYDRVGMVEIKNKLDRVDLEHTVSVIEEFIKEQDETKELNNSVKKALIGVNEILNRIHDELIIIKEAVEYHNSKYFSRWRRFDCSCNIETIIAHKEILDKRYNMFVELMNIYK